MSRLLGWLRGGPPARDRSEVERLLRRHGLTALDRQVHLQDLVGEESWQLDQDAGTISFGPLVCAAQILGTQSDTDRTWLWAWANPSVPDAVRRDAERIRDHGQRHGVSHFTDAQAPLDPSMPPEMLALIATELTGADGYYRGPYEGGAVFVLLRLPAGAAKAERGDVRRTLRTLGLGTMVLSVGLDRESVEAYLASTGLTASGEADELVAEDASGRSVSVRFDRAGRVRDIRTTLGEEPA